jgi:hypothetical protein
MPIIIRKPAIRAFLVGSNRCDGAGFTVRGRSPLLKLCRALIKAGYAPGLPLHAYRGNTLSLHVRTIGEGARLTIKTAGSGCPIFAPIEGAAAPLVRKFVPTASDHTKIERISPDT